MKKIKLRQDLFNGNERITSLSILRLVTANSPNRPIGVEEMRQRVRILDALEDCTPSSDELRLEDADVKVLSQAIEGFPWANASKGLLLIIDDVLKAETLPPPMKLVEGDKKEKTQ